MEKEQTVGESLERRENAVVLIPAYNPDEKLLGLLDGLEGFFSRVVVVDDGSTKGGEVFLKARSKVEKILVHPVNRGKGAALKTGLDYIGACDVVTADADGQHLAGDILRVAQALGKHRGGIVLGVRDFSGSVPFRSRFGNFWTRIFFFLMSGLNIRDTQTGLRGIPSSLVKRVSGIAGDRYEFEMAMLADARHHESKPLQIPISTLYIDSNSASHFNPLADTLRIYRSLIQYCLSSVLSFLVDNALYAFVVWRLSASGMSLSEYTLVAMVVSRILSANFNYFYNRFVVFGGNRSKGCGRKHCSYLSYWALVLAIGSASYFITEFAASALGIDGVGITLVKILADMVLFFAGYFIQKHFVFRGARVA